MIIYCFSLYWVLSCFYLPWLPLGTSFVCFPIVSCQFVPAFLFSPCLPSISSNCVGFWLWPVGLDWVFAFALWILLLVLDCSLVSVENKYYELHPSHLCVASAFGLSHIWLEPRHIHLNNSVKGSAMQKTCPALLWSFESLSECFHQCYSFHKCPKLWRHIVFSFMASATRMSVLKIYRQWKYLTVYGGRYWLIHDRH